MESKKFLTSDEVAAEFGLDEAALKQLVDSGEVRALADRGTWKYRRDELQGLVDAGTIPAVAPYSPTMELDAGDQVLKIQAAEDDVSYIELDEDALAEQATMITKSSPFSPQPSAEPEEDWFVPSDVEEMAPSFDGPSADPVFEPDERYDQWN